MVCLMTDHLGPRLFGALSRFIRGAVIYDKDLYSPDSLDFSWHPGDDAADRLLFIQTRDDHKKRLILPRFVFS